MAALLIVVSIIVVLLFVVVRRNLAIRRETREIARVAKLMRDYDMSQRQREMDAIWGSRNSS